MSRVLDLGSSPARPVEKDNVGSSSTSSSSPPKPASRFAQSMGGISTTSPFFRQKPAGDSSVASQSHMKMMANGSPGIQARSFLSAPRFAERASPASSSSGQSGPSSILSRAPVSVSSSQSSQNGSTSKRALSVSSGSDLSDAPSPPPAARKKMHVIPSSSPAHTSPAKPAPALPKTEAQSKTTPAPQQHKKAGKAFDLSDEEDAGDPGPSDREFDDESDSEQERLNETRAVQWFNKADAKQLMDVIGISDAQAETIIGLRPFSNGDRVRAKLRGGDGVRPKMFDDCVECLHGLQQLDGVLAKCEKLGQRLTSAFVKAGVEADEGEAMDEGNDTEIPRGVQEGQQPEGLADGIKLKDFQLRGLNWLWLLFERGCSGILADDMGLGKTAQVISFISLTVQRLERGPHLIVVPSSVLDNWMREFKTFGPDLRIFKYHGSQSARSEQRMELREYRDEYDVVLTTYDMASGGSSGADKDHIFLRKFGFDACIFDEGHILKNRKSLKYTKLLKIRAKWRLILTGTPLQNNLSELISLLQFIMPTYFRGAEEALTQIFQVKQAGQLSEERVKRAKQMMQPFVLRRRKIDVLHDLQPKTEIIKYCEMTPKQSEVYQETFAKSKAALLEQQRLAEEAEAAKSKKTAGGSARSSKASTPLPNAAPKAGHVLIDLRKAANHPLLFRRIYEGQKLDALVRDYRKTGEFGSEPLAHTREDLEINSDAELCMSIAMQYKECSKHLLANDDWLNSGKILALRDVINEAKEQGERVIIFSQFVLTLEIICRALEILDITYRGFTGSTDVTHRQKLVDEFTNDESISCFLLSTRAGGVGINLMAANWVVLYDQDYNPQNDQQAADRCYRIGQTRPVTIVRLLSKGTIDEQIYALGKRKLRLAQRVQGESAEGNATLQVPDSAAMSRTTSAAASTVASAVDSEEEDDDGEMPGANTMDKRDKRVEQALLASLVAGNGPSNA